MILSGSISSYPILAMGRTPASDGSVIRGHSRNNMGFSRTATRTSFLQTPDQNLSSDNIQIPALIFGQKSVIAD